MIELTPATLPDFQFSDAQLTGVTWLENGRDIRLDIITGDARRVSLTCALVSGLQVHLLFRPRHSGHPLAASCTFEHRGAQWHVRFDFAAEGHVELDCEGVQATASARG